MYSTCIFCHSPLGRNEAIEHFPVGRRLAFDGAKGRLWAVCAKCGRWNLTPIEERWEAIEECEKQYRSTIKRASTDQIGLARVSEGTDLIRIGEPLRPEFASWRYGRHFKRRRALAIGGVGVSIGIGGVMIALGLGSGVGLVSPTAGMVITLLNRKNEVGRAKRFIRQRAEAAFGRKVRKSEDVDVRMIETTDDQGWGLRFALHGRFLDFTGQEALHVAHIVTPAINDTGSFASKVSRAVREIEEIGAPEMYFRRLLAYGESRGWKYTPIGAYPEEMRLALEMVSHEERERAVMTGELATLEADWREAEEIAAIADNLFVPQAFTDFIRRHRT